MSRVLAAALLVAIPAAALVPPPSAESVSATGMACTERLLPASEDPRVDASDHVCHGVLDPASPVASFVSSERRGVVVHASAAGLEPASDVDLRILTSTDEARSQNGLVRPETATLVVRTDGVVTVELALARGSAPTPFALVVHLERAPTTRATPPPPPPPDDDCGSGGDAPEDEALLVAPGTCSGRMRDYSDVDAYEIDVPADTVLVARVLSDQAGIEVHLQRGDQYAFGGFSGEETALYAGEGRYRVVVTSWSRGPYTLELALVPFADTPDCGAPGDAPSGDGGVVLTAPVTCTASADLGDVVDTYLVPVAAGASVVLDLADAPGLPYHWMTVRDAVTGEAMLTSYVGDALRSTVADGAARTWTVRVFSYGQGESVPYTLALGEGPAVAPADCGEPGDAPWVSSARPLAAGVVCEATLLGSDVDAFVLDTPAAPHVVEVTLEQVAGPVRGAVAPAGFGFGPWTHVRPAEPAPLYLTGGEGPMYAYVLGADEDAAYRLSYRILADAQADCGAPYDAPSTLAAARPRGEGTCAGAFDHGDFEDAYVIDADPGDFLEFDGRSLSGGADFRGAVFADGPFRFRVMPDHDLPQEAYELTIVRHDRDDLDDCGAGRDAGAPSGGAAALELPVACEGAWTTTADTVDTYSFETFPGEVLVVRVTPSDGRLSGASLRDPLGRQTNFPLSSNVGGATVFAAFVEKPGTWTLDLHAGAPGGYGLEILAPFRAP